MTTRVTILDVEPDIAALLRKKGVKGQGNKFLKAAYIMDQAGITDHLLTMYENKSYKTTVELLDLLTKAVDIGRIIAGDNDQLLTREIQPEAEPPAEIQPDPVIEDDSPAPMFGA